MADDALNALIAVIDPATPAEEAAQRIAAYRAEVLGEAADAVIAENDRQLWATKPGRHWAADLLRRMASNLKETLK